MITFEEFLIIEALLFLVGLTGFIVLSLNLKHLRILIRSEIRQLGRDIGHVQVGLREEIRVQTKSIIRGEIIAQTESIIAAVSKENREEDKEEDKVNDCYWCDSAPNVCHNKDAFWIRCPNDECQVIGPSRDTIEEAINDWNSII